MTPFVFNAINVKRMLHKYEFQAKSEYSRTKTQKLFFNLWSVYIIRSHV